MRISPETEKVPVSKEKRQRQSLAAAALVGVGVWILVTGHNRFDGLFWGIAVSVLGCVFIVLAMRKHEFQLTAASKAVIAAQDARSRRRDAAIMSWVFWIGLIAFAIYCIEPISDGLQGRIKAYPVRCDKWSYGAATCEGGVEHAESQTTYIVHVEQQLVVSLSEDATEPKRLFNCVVADRQNWTCTVDPEKNSLHAIMYGGNFYFDPPNPYLAGLRYTSRLKWWVLKLGF
jgi:hypothetical protein